MRNKKGFTLIELIVSVVLVSVVLVALIGSLLQLRSAYSVVHENSDVIVYTSSISRVINSDINANSGIKFISCETDGKKCSLILGNDERRELIITENDKILDDAEEGITHTNNKTTLKYMDTTRYDKTNNEADKILLYIRTLELDKYSNDNAQVTTSSGYNFYDMSANQYEYFDERGRYLDAFTTLTIRLLDGVNLDLSKYNITLYGAGRYDYSKYIGRAFRIDLDNNEADTAGTTTIDEVFGVGFFKAESSHTKKDQIKKITIPTKKDGDEPQVFLGYFYEPYGVNVETQIIDASGNIYADPRTFKNDVILNDSTTGRVYAKWSPTAPGFRLPPGCIENCTPEPEEYTVTLNKDQRGKTCNSVGTNNYVVKYSNMVPPVEIPQCAGYTFEGYLYNDVDLYHDRNGNGKKLYEIVGNATFDAQWHACEQGQYSLITQQTCSDCAKGSIAPTSASGECTPCQNGKTTNGVKSTACSATCPNSNEHVLEWKTAVWNENTNELTNECTIASCKDGYTLGGNVCTANTYTVEYYQGNNASSAGSTKLTSSSHTYDQPQNLTAYSGTPPSGWTFAGWSTSVSGTDRTYSNSQSVVNLTSIANGVVKLYAVFKRTITVYSGVNKATTNTYTQYYNPRTTSNITSVTLPTPTSINNWTTLGYRTDTTANTSTQAAGSITPTYNATALTYYAVYSRDTTANFHSGVNKATNNPITVTAYYNTNTASLPTTWTFTLRNVDDSQNIANWTELGWRDDTSSLTKEYDYAQTGVSITIGTTANYYSVYSRTLTISYNGNGNSGGSTSATTKTIYLNTNSTTTSSQSVTLATNGFTKTGHAFSKWAAGSTSGTQYAAGANFTSGVAYDASTFGGTMYAIWAVSCQSGHTYNASTGKCEYDATPNQWRCSRTRPTVQLYSYQPYSCWKNADGTFGSGGGAIVENATSCPAVFTVCNASHIGTYRIGNCAEEGTGYGNCPNNGYASGGTCYVWVNSVYNCPSGYSNPVASNWICSSSSHSLSSDHVCSYTP